MSDFTTWASAAVIIIVFLLFCKEEYKLYNIKEAIKICEEAYKIGKELEASKGETP